MTEILEPDDFKIGIWFVVTDSNIVSPEVVGHICKFMPTGVPWQIKAISLPFIVASNGSEHATLYTPHYTFRRVTRQYVKYFQEHIFKDSKNNETTTKWS